MVKLRPLNISSKENKTLQSNKIRQVKDFLDSNYDIRVNRFKPNEKEILCKTKEYEYSPSIDDIILHLLENEISVSDNILKKIISSPNQIRTYDPIREFFENLEPYEGISHIDKLCKLMEAVNYDDKPEGYYQTRMLRLIKKWLVASVACSLREQQNEVALGFIQEEEGTGKTTICQFLCPPPLKPMMIKSDKEKNGFKMKEAFTENFLILFDEFIGLNKFTAESFKSTMSSTELDVKAPKESFHKRKERIANAMFTTNNRTGMNKGFLIPALGTRRFACIHLKEINYEAIMSDINVNQIWAEAYLLFKSGNYDYKFGPEDFAEFKEFNQRFMIETNATQLIEANFTHPINGTDGTWMQPVEILQHLKQKKVAGRDVLNSLSPHNIGTALTQLGFSKEMRRKKPIGPRYMYHVKPI